MKTWTQETECDSCGEPLTIELEQPIETRRDVWIYGTTRVEFYEDYVRIPMSDWNDIKQRLIPVLKQGDRKYGNAETGS